jgi:hypothetical protein
MLAQGRQCGVIGLQQACQIDHLQWASFDEPI